ncbi:MAG: hypothetical protein CM15mP77_0470 [Synechococcus sp.]|nr:MAG: hypothetical protein CM15mP77_0470 [Synechococcus sp.]
MSQRFETLQLHAGQSPDAPPMPGRCRSTKTSSYVFNDAEHGANLFGLKEFGNIYTRLMNPTTDVFEKRVAALEGGWLHWRQHPDSQLSSWRSRTACRQATTSSPRRSSTAAPTTSSRCSSRLGIDVGSPMATTWTASPLRSTTTPKGLYVEAMGNPRFNIPDFDGLSALAKERGIR